MTPGYPPPAGEPLPSAEPPARPDTVKLALQLWAFIVACQTVWTISLYPMLFEETDRLRGQADNVVDDSVKTTIAVAGTVLHIVVAGGLTLLMMFFVARGYGWARLVLGWLSAFLAVMLIFDAFGLLFGAGDDSLLGAPAWGTVFRILGGVAAMGALTALMNKDSARYCRDVAQYRAGTRNGPGGR